MKNLKVRTKLLFSFGILSLLIIGMILTGITSLNSIRTEVDVYSTETYAVVSALSVAREKMEAIQKGIYSAVTNMSNQNDKLPDSDLKSINVSFATIQEQITLIDTFLKVDRDLFDTFNKEFSSLASMMKKIEDDGRTRMVLNNEMVPQISRITTVLAKLSSNSENHGTTSIEAINSDVKTTIYIFIGAGVIALAAAAWLCMAITRSITKPLHEMKAVAVEMANGNLGIKLSYSSKNELGAVCNSMREMAATLDSYVGDIRRAMKELANGDLNIAPKVAFMGDFVEIEQSIVGAVEAFNGALMQISTFTDQVSTGAAQLSSGVLTLSQGATEQASAVEELAATINEISAQVRDNAENARIARNKVSYVGTEVENSNSNMQNMIAAMDDISRSSNEIGKIIKTIEDIAFQTNLLALNASVEAARAGNAGKGFAVVADEVRNLANRSAAASKNTSELIDNSLRAVANGAKIASDTARSLTQVVSGASEVTIAIERISNASGHQAEALQQITVGIDQISSIVQTNSATSEQSAAASEELSSQAQVLKNLVGEFNLKSTTAVPVSREKAPQISAAFDLNKPLHAELAHPSDDNARFVASGRNKY